MIYRIKCMYCNQFYIGKYNMNITILLIWRNKISAHLKDNNKADWKNVKNLHGGKTIFQKMFDRWNVYTYIFLRSKEKIYIYKSLDRVINKRSEVGLGGTEYIDNLGNVNWLFMVLVLQTSLDRIYIFQKELKLIKKCVYK